VPVCLYFNQTLNYKKFIHLDIFLIKQSISALLACCHAAAACPQPSSDGVFIFVVIVLAIALVVDHAIVNVHRRHFRRSLVGPENGHWAPIDDRHRPDQNVERRILVAVPFLSAGRVLALDKTLQGKVAVLRQARLQTPRCQSLALVSVKRTQALRGYPAKASE
jgi:hypothetical protein